MLNEETFMRPSRENLCHSYFGVGRGRTAFCRRCSLLGVLPRSRVTDPKGHSVLKGEVRLASSRYGLSFRSSIG